MHDFASGCSPQNQVHATRADIACVSAVGAPLHAAVACAPASGAFRLHVPCRCVVSQAGRACPPVRAEVRGCRSPPNRWARPGQRGGLGAVAYVRRILRRARVRRLLPHLVHVSAQRVAWLTATRALQVVHVADLVEQATRRQEHRRLCLGFSRFLLSCATPCKCSCGDKGSYVWHNYKPLTEKLEDFIESVLGAYVDRDSVVVAAAHVLRRFMLARNAPVCRDMTLRLVAVAVCVSAKYWDEGASFRRNNAQIASRAGIALEGMSPGAARLCDCVSNSCCTLTLMLAVCRFQPHGNPLVA